MDIESYRIYRNRPTPLMGFPICYYFSDKSVCELGGFDKVQEAICQKHPNASEVKPVRSAAWTFIGVIEKH